MTLCLAGAYGQQKVFPCAHFVDLRSKRVQQRLDVHQGLANVILVCWPGPAACVAQGAEAAQLLLHQRFHLVKSRNLLAIRE